MFSEQTLKPYYSLLSGSRHQLQCHLYHVYLVFLDSLFLTFFSMCVIVFHFSQCFVFLCLVRLLRYTRYLKIHCILRYSGESGSGEGECSDPNLHVSLCLFLCSTKNTISAGSFGIRLLFPKGYY